MRDLRAHLRTGVLPPMEQVAPLLRPTRLDLWLTAIVVVASAFIVILGATNV